jgi:hypothetical protein
MFLGANLDWSLSSIIICIEGHCDNAPRYFLSLIRIEKNDAARFGRVVTHKLANATHDRRELRIRQPQSARSAGDSA